MAISVQFDFRKPSAARRAREELQRKRLQLGQRQADIREEELGFSRKQLGFHKAQLEQKKIDDAWKRENKMQEMVLKLREEERKSVDWRTKHEIQERKHRLLSPYWQMGYAIGGDNQAAVAEANKWRAPDDQYVRVFWNPEVDMLMRFKVDGKPDHLPGKRIENYKHYAQSLGVMPAARTAQERRELDLGKGRKPGAFAIGKSLTEFGRYYDISDVPAWKRKAIESAINQDRTYEDIAEELDIPPNPEAPFEKAHGNLIKAATGVQTQVEEAKRPGWWGNRGITDRESRRIDAASKAFQVRLDEAHAEKARQDAVVGGARQREQELRQQYNIVSRGLKAGVNPDTGEPLDDLAKKDAKTALTVIEGRIRDIQRQLRAVDQTQRTLPSGPAVMPRSELVIR